MFKLICDNISESRSIVILNLLNLEYINSSGVNIFLKILTKSRNLGGDSILCNLNSVIEKLLITTKLNTIFRVQNQIENLEDFMNKN
jgi:anti-sigma B factor antagonist